MEEGFGVSQFDRRWFLVELDVMEPPQMAWDEFLIWQGSIEFLL